MNLVLNFVGQTQEQSEWCWSAVSVSVSLFYNATSGWIQCSMANQELGGTTCCQDGATDNCDRPWYLDRALTRTRNLNNISWGPSSFAQVVTEIQQGRALAVRISWSGSGNAGHFLTIAGFDDSDPANLLVYVVDPAPGTAPGWVPYNTLVSAYKGSGVWTHSFRTQP